MATKRVEEIYEEHIEALPMVDRLRLVELITNELAATISRDVSNTRCLLELEGLGEEIWHGINPQAYVNELRREWG